MDQDAGRPSRGAVIVLDPSARHALAAVRGLGSSGWRPVVAGREAVTDAIAASSRHASGYHRIPNPWGPALPFESALRRLIRRYDAAAVLASSDVTVARLRDLDLGVPTVPTLGSPLDLLIDKHDLAQVCARAGVLYPTSWLPGEIVTRPLDWPLIVKPRRTAIATRERVVSQTGARVVRDVEQLRQAVSDLKVRGLDALVQRRVERRFKVNVSLIRRGRQTSFHIAYRVVREYPPEGGLAATTETIDPTNGVGARALDAAARVCDEAGYAGLANVEFYGQADGDLCLIEVNPRAWGSIWLPEKLGLEPTSRAVEDAIGQPARPVPAYPVGRRFHRPTLELKWLLSRSDERGSRTQLIRSLSPADVYDVVSLSDPLPVIHAAGQMVIRNARSITSLAHRFRR